MLIAVVHAPLRTERDIGIGPMEPLAAPHVDWLDAHLAPVGLEFFEHVLVMSATGVPTYELRWRSADDRHRLAVRIPTAPGPYEAHFLSRRPSGTWIASDFPESYPPEERGGWLSRGVNASSLAEAFDDHRRYVGDAASVEVWPSLETRWQRRMQSSSDQVRPSGEDELRVTWRGARQALRYMVHKLLAPPHDEWMHDAPRPLEHLQDTPPIGAANRPLMVAHALGVAGTAVAVACVAWPVSLAVPLLAVLGAFDLVQWASTCLIWGRGHAAGPLLPWHLATDVSYRSAHLATAILVGPGSLLLVERLHLLPSSDAGGRAEILALLVASVALLPSRRLVGGRLVDVVFGPSPNVALGLELVASGAIGLIAVLVGPSSLLVLSVFLFLLAMAEKSDADIAWETLSQARSVLESHSLDQRPTCALGYARGLAQGARAERIATRWLRWMHPMGSLPRFAFGTVYVGLLAIAWSELGWILLELAQTRWPLIVSVLELFS